jgi:aminopeptidase N
MVSLLAALVLLALPRSPKPPTEPPQPTLRLPATVHPLRGRLDLTLDPRKDDFHGVAGYDLTLDDPQALVWINATALKLEEVSFSLGDEKVDATVVPGDDDFVGLRPARPIGPGEATLTISYRGSLDKVRSQGLYRVAENPGSADEAWYLYSFFEATDARRAFPCFDEPGFKIPWTLTLRVPRADVALANAAVRSETTQDDTRTVVFAESKPLPSYLVALIVGPFDLVDAGTAGRHGTPLRFAVPKGRTAELRFAREATPRIVDLLEDYFGMPYPYGKLDVAVPPRYWGTMEHPGLVALGQPITLIKPEAETLPRREFFVTIAGHELAHYWFGDYVTMAWWDDTWLNEALGEWMDAKITSAYDPAWGFMTDRLGETSAAMQKDSLASAKAIRQPVISRTDIESSFDGELTYVKGSAVLRMFEEWVGEGRWQAFVRSYLSAHAWGNATTDDFLAAMKGTLGGEPAEALATFLAQPGVPLVDAELRCDTRGARLVLKQARFLPQGSGGTATQRWSIPVCARWGGPGETGRGCTLLTGAAGELVLDRQTCPTWVMPNADGFGYYRVAHTPAGVSTLFPKGGSPLTAAEQAAVVGDIAALVQAGTFSVGDALARVPAIVADGERHALLATLEIVADARAAFLADDDYARYRRFLARTYGERARALGWVPATHEGPDATLLRAPLLRMVAFAAEDEALASQARALASAWLDDRRALDDTVADVALDVAAMHGDRALFERILDQARRPGLEPRERQTLFSALGRFRDSELADAALAVVSDTAFDLRDTSGILFRVLYARGGRERGWTFVKKHWDALAARMRADEQTWTIENVTKAFCDPAHRADAAAFFGERSAKVDGGPRALANALETVDLCIGQRQANATAVTRFLSAYDEH